MRILRRFLLPFAVVVMAAALGTFVIGRVHVAASSSAMQNPGMKLTASNSLNNAGMIAAGRILFTQTCSTCHGGEAQGTSLGPNLQGVGGATVDLWISAGWMPLRTPQTQPEAKPAYFTRQQINEIVAYVVSLKPGGVPVPDATSRSARRTRPTASSSSRSTAHRATRSPAPVTPLPAVYTPRRCTV